MSTFVITVAIYINMSLKSIRTDKEIQFLCVFFLKIL